MARVLITRLAILVLLVGLFTPWQAGATCLSRAESRKLVAETAREIVGKKVRGKKKASLHKLANVVNARRRAAVSTAERRAWERLYDAMRPLLTSTASCRVSGRTNAKMTAILASLLSRPKIQVFDIVAVQYLFAHLSHGADDSWS